MGMKNPKLKRILLVDDNEDHLLIEKTIFEQTIPDLKVEAAKSGQECLEKIKEEDFDCIVSDYKLGPGVDGLELLQTLRRMDVDIPFFIVSSHDESKLKEEAFRRGAKGLISKDEQLNDFQGVARTIDQIIEEYLCLL